MNYHLIETIFINLPITTAYEQLWLLISSADGLEAFNHYFKTNKIHNLKPNSFSRQISLRFPLKLNTQKTTQQIEPTIKINQQALRNQKDQKIIYRNLPSKQSNLALKEGQQSITGEFFHQFEQNNKGQTYLIFGSSAKNDTHSFPQKSQAQIQLIKIKDLLENGFQNHLQHKGSYFTKCC